jgi:hypothetical protein
MIIELHEKGTTKRNMAELIKDFITLKILVNVKIDWLKSTYRGFRTDEK